MSIADIVERAAAPGRQTEADIRQWKGDIAEQALASPGLVFAICAAFAAPMAKLLGMRPFAFHLFGLDVADRWLVTEVAASLYGRGEHGRGGNLISWTGLSERYGVVGSASDEGLLLPYEFDEADPKLHALIAAKLWHSDPRPPAPWAWCDTITLSVGGTLFDEELIRNAGGPGPVRLFNIPPDLGQGRMLFEHSLSHVDDQRLRHAASESKGIVGVEWLRHLNGLRPAALSQLVLCDAVNEAAVEHFTRLPTLEFTKCFRVLSLAGTLATQQGFTGWPAGAATDAVGLCMYAWGRTSVGRRRMSSAGVPFPSHSATASRSSVKP